MAQPIKGFSKLSRAGKIEWLANTYFKDTEQAIQLLDSYLHNDARIQKLHDEFIENTITNYYLPLGVAPNFLINGQLYAIPMAIEESSVVAAAAKSAQFWLTRGGFKAEVLSTRKIGHVHFFFNGDAKQLNTLIQASTQRFLDDTAEITANMRARGGGILDLRLVDKTLLEPGYFQLEAHFDTRDSMGANFINTCLERFAQTLEQLIHGSDFSAPEKESFQVVMRILSNYTPECIVRAEVSCKVEDLTDDSGVSPEEFAQKFVRAVRIAEIEPYRATTHNKGIMNGVDAVVIATGNDFRAVEAACHTFAGRNGRYQSLTHAEVKDGIFRFWIEIPLALGVVGGLTTLHPMVKFALEMLGKPSAPELMGIVATSGLAQNFAALRALVTTGIQKGHMKMHLFNILNQLEATEAEREAIVKFFKDKVPHHREVVNKFCELRGIKDPSSVYKH
jgi:hydroxymethylglutaryl-CoA reductase